jgi:hypothetical protein
LSPRSYKGVSLTTWAEAIAARIADEWDGKVEFPEDAIELEKVLASLLKNAPDKCLRLIGTGIIEANHFSLIDKTPPWTH